MQTIAMLNPNSSTMTTRAIAASAATVRLPDDITIACETSAAGPPAIESQADFEAASRLVPEELARIEASVFVVACFADPGLADARGRLESPVLGLAESSYLLAASLGRRFGIVSTVEAAIGRHARQLRSLGLDHACAGDRALGLGVADLHDAGAFAHILAAARALKDADGADVVILGCASMGVYRRDLEAALAIPVVDPVQAAAVRAAGLLTLGYQRVA